MYSNVLQHFRMGVVPNGGTSHEKHIKMAVLDNQAKIQQVQPKYREVKRKKSFGVF